MSGNPDREHLEQSITEGLQKILDRHGYGFHYAVIGVAATLYNKGSSSWSFQAAEFPVEVRGCSTRIDFVLWLRSENLYLVAECKRANPALSNWCFVAAPYVRRKHTPGQILVERVSVDKEGELSAGATTLSSSSEMYHIGLEVKSSERGDPCGQGRGAIEDAATQVCRGLNGMVEFLALNSQILERDRPAWIVPVIFTTAKIWTSGVDLQKADLETGRIDLKGADVKQKRWVWYRYHQSPGIKHTVRLDKMYHEIGEILDQRYARATAVVSAAGIEDFLTREWW